MKITRLFDILDHQVTTWPGRKVLAKKSFGKWLEYDTDTYFRKARALALAALDEGLGKGDVFATLVRTNLPEWNMVDMGLLQIGMIHVPLHPGVSEENARYILTKTGVKVLFVQDRKEWEKYRSVIKSIPTIRYILTFNRIKGMPHWTSWVRQGQQRQKKVTERYNHLRHQILPEDTATIVFTSGTTGQPKGVVLSHANLVSNVLAASNLQPLDFRHTVLSFLPLSHIYERTSNYLFQLKGVRICYAESYLHVRENLQEIRPHGITVVPRFLEKVEDTILAQSKTLKKMRAYMYDRAMQLHLYYRVDHKNSFLFRLKQRLYDVLIYRKIRLGLGGRILFIGCGGAPLSLLTEKFFWTLRLPVFQGYGLTETSPLIALNHLPRSSVHLGTVGPVVPGVSIRLSSDGEIRVKGPGVMKGYYKDKKATKQVFDAQGWFCTGDLGRMIEGGFLKITGRKKELFKTSYGKYIVPQLIEIKLRRSRFINNALVYGEGRKFPGVILQPDFAYLREWLHRQGIKRKYTREKIILLEPVTRVIESEVGKVNQTLDEHERIRVFHIVPDQWTVASGDLSASHKLKRVHLINKYRHLIEKTYAQSE